VTGVSGSGNSTLVDDILRRALFRHFYNAKEKPGAFRGLRGSIKSIRPSSLIRVQLGARRDRIRSLTVVRSPRFVNCLHNFPAARVRGYDAGRFSFNVKGGRCEHCEGGGLIKIEMHFFAGRLCRVRSLSWPALQSRDARITYKGKNIADVLDLSVDEAARFFPKCSERVG